MAGLPTANRYRAGVALAALAALSACGGGGGGGGVVSTPPPPVQITPPPPAPPPPPPPPTGFDTTEYRNSNAVVQANAIGAYSAGATGAGVVVAVVDSGVAAGNAEFAGRIHPASADLAGNRGIGDDGGHGTAVSHVLLGAKNDSQTHGIAFNATLLVARTDTPGSCNANPDEGCSHNDNNIARGVDLAVANGARVINISLGGSPANNALRNAIGRATAAGVILVFSGGNDFDTDPVAAANPDPLAQIANDAAVSRGLILIAGALDSTNANLTNFSNRAGNGADNYIGALGSRVLAIDETGTAFRFGGTSFAAPAVAGAVALLAQAFPNLTAAQIVDLLKRSATDLGTTGTDTIFGRGALNIGAAFQPQGQASLAGSAIPVTLGAAGTASPAMGDGGQTGMGAVILDGYGRAFDTRLGASRAAPRAPMLAAGLSAGTQTMNASGANAAFALSVAPLGGEAAVDRLLLSAHERKQARALAGSALLRLNADTLAAFGVGTGGRGLADRLDPAMRTDFLTGRDPLGFQTRPKSGMALSHRMGGLLLTGFAEAGDTRLFENASGLSPRHDARRYGYGLAGVRLSQAIGPLAISAAISNLNEDQTLLGGRFDPLYGVRAAQTRFADLGADWWIAPGWRLGLDWRQGWTRVAAGGVRDGTDRLNSTAWSAMLEAPGPGRSDTLAFRIAQPLRVAKGGFDLTLPVAYDYATLATTYAPSRLSLAPTGREIDAEAVWAMPLGRGWLSTNLYWRTEPGHIETAPDDVGAAIRYSLGF